MSRLADARTKLFDALVLFLGDGRVWAYPPRKGQGFVAPACYIEQPSVTRETIGTRSTMIAAAFPIWLVYDGADAAQVAALDDMLSLVWDACEATANVEPMIARPSEIDVGGPTLRAVVVQAGVHIAARTLCNVEPPPPAAAEPELVEV